MIPSKLIVVDPFGDAPVVMSGSHNLGKKASSENDNNLVIVTGASGLAREYAVYIQVVFDAYKWRYERGQLSSPGANTWNGLARDDTWQHGHAGQPAYTEWPGRRCSSGPAVPRTPPQRYSRRTDQAHQWGPRGPVPALARTPTSQLGS